MRLGEAVACAAIAVSLTAATPARAEDAPLPPPGEARPPLPPEPALPAAPWQQHVEIGVGVAFTQMVASAVNSDGSPTQVRFKPGVGFHIEVTWPVLRYLGLTGYLVEHDDSLFLPPGALGVQVLEAPGQFNPAFAHSYSFGMRVSPTIPLGSRVNLWLTAGAGWGLVQYGMTVQGSEWLGRAPGQVYRSESIVLPSRSEDLFEIPFGVGGSIEIIPRWLSLRLEVTAAWLPSQTGSALQVRQYIGADRVTLNNFAPMPHLDTTCVETLGLMLHL